ncbi:putative Ig domain-containing protein [Spirosoma agri]|uniref:T9SS type A sorting domain-containing protein n=1 Tax=Spirosoma agri TaxID=1987381 RepID=A0A6M0IIT0_9BACT|nr:putative Ig domain-containing protein [Spirosoma agri]NEU68159.1 T9SS type A sorting domain-containing protein [Spirosoma agri]
MRFSLLLAFLLTLVAGLTYAQTPTRLFLTRGSGTSSNDALLSVDLNGSLPSTGTVLANDAGNFTQPSDLLYDPATNFLYVVDEYVPASGGGGGVFRYLYNPSTNSVSNRTALVASNGFSYRGLSLDAANNRLYVSQGDANNVTDALLMLSNVTGNGPFTATTLVIGTAADGGFTNPADLVFDPASNYLYVSDQFINTGSIIRYTVNGSGTAVSNRTVVIAAAGSGSIAPGGLALDQANGQLYFTTFTSSNATGDANDALKQVNVGNGASFPGTPSTIINGTNSSLTVPQDLALDRTNGSIYVSNAATGGQVYRYTTSGNNETAIVPGTAVSTYTGLALNGGFTTSSTTVTAINRTGTIPTSAGSVTYSVVFAASVTGLTTNNFSVTPTGSISGASVSSVSGSGTNYTVTVNTGTGSGTLTLNLANSSGVSPTVSNTPFSGQTYTIDKTAPTVSSVSVPANATYRAGQTLSFSVNFAENVIVSGTPQLPLTIGTTTRQANYVSGSGSSALVFTYTVQTGELDTDGIALASALTLNGGTIRDNVNNNATLTLNGVPSTTGILVDAVAPTVTITSSAGPSGSTTGTNPIPFTITFSESVTGLVAGGVSVTGGTPTGFSGSGTIYTLNVTPTANGAVTVNVAANVAQDAAGNGNAAASPFSITYSQPVTAAPVVTSPANSSQLNTSTPTYAGTAPANSTVTVYVDNTAIGTTTANGGTWSLTQPTAIANGTHSVYATAQLSGQAVSANSNTNSFTVDTTVPTVSSVNVPTNATYRAGQTLSFSVNFAENVAVAGTPQLPLTIGSTTRQANYTSGSGSSALVFTYTVQTGELDTDGIALASALTLNGGTIRDNVSNNATLTLNGVPSTTGILVDAVAPTVTITSSAGPSGSTTGTNPIPFTITFSESVTGLVAGGVSVTGGTPTGFSGSGTIYTLNVTPSTNGAVVVNVAANVAQDAAGNGNAAASPFSITYSQPVTAAPVVTSPANSSQLNTSTPTYAGTAPASSTVTVYVDNNAIGTTTAIGGSWSLTQPTALANSTHSVYATAQVSGQAVSANSNTNTFTVNNSMLSLALSVNELCANSPLSLTATATNIGSPVTYSLSSSPAGFSGSGTSPQFTLTAPAIESTTAFTLTVTATSTAGNASATAVVTVNPLPTATLVASGTLTCAQPSITLTAQGGTSYQFSGPGLVSQSANTALVNVAGTYSVTVSSGSGCSSTTSVAVSQENSLPTVTITPASSTLTCANPTLQLTANSSVSTLRWSTGASTPSISVSAAGTYSVTATGTNGCTATASAQVIQDNTVPTPSLTASALTTVNQPISVTASGCSGTLTWQVQGGAGQANGSVYTLTQPGNYTLSATCTVGSCTSPPAPVLLLTIQAPNTNFAITGVTMVNCYQANPSRGEYLVQFTPQYAGQNSNPISFSVVRELAPTTQPAPYVLNLYQDNPVITLVANQAGNGEARYNYNWLASCNSGSSPNQPPTTLGIGAQTLTVNQPYQLNLSSYFTDPEGQPLTYSATGLPAGLSVAGSVLSGTPSQTGTFGVSITAIDPGNLSVSSNFTLTVQTQPSQPTAFTIASVNTVSCEVLSAGQRRVRFTPQYSGLSGQPITFRVVNELAPTTQAAPYSLDLYTDNPVIELRASQAGTAGEVSFSYNWLAACGSTPPVNGAPTVTQTIPNQVGAVNQAFSYSIPAGTFTDPNGDALVLTASGLPSGLSLNGSVISGTPSSSGVSTVSITATDPGNLSASTRFTLTINQITIPPTQDFAITGVSLLTCQAVNGQQRLIRFSPQYSGLTGQPVSFSVANELAPTNAGGPYELRLYLDNPVIVLKAAQAGTANEASFSYNWLAACGSASGRRPADELPAFNVVVLGNPVESTTAEVAIHGAQGQTVAVRVVDLQGKLVATIRIEQAQAVERVSLPLGTSSGVLLLEVRTPTQYQQVKLVKH